MFRTRLLLVAILGVLALLATAVLSGGTGSTQARWAEQQQLTLPALGAGSIALGAANGTSGLSPETVLTNASGFGLEYAPTAVTFTSRPGSATTSAEATGFLTQGTGTTFRYHAGTTGCAASTGTGRWASAQRDGAVQNLAVAPVSGLPRDPLATGGQRSLCVAVKPSPPSTASQLLAYAGREFQLTTALQAVSAGPGSWSRTSSWVTPYVVPLPAATARSTTPCVAGSGVTLNWAWPDAATSAATPTAAIDRWEIRVKGNNAAGWTVLRNDIAGNQRTATVDATNVGGYNWGAHTSYELRVRAYPFAGSTAKYVDSASTWRVTRSGTAFACQSPVAASPAPAPAGYDVEFR